VILLAAASAGLIHGEEQQRLPRRREIPFDSHRRRMTVVIESSEAVAAVSLPAALGVRK
jgi:magnesium-transporting ATPase (P-type)